MEEPSPDWIRRKAFCIASRGDEILVIPNESGATGERYYRPPGGTIKDDRDPESELIREFREEFGVTLTDLERVETLENTVTLGEEVGRERVKVYDGRIEEESAYERGRLTGGERLGGGEREAVWMSVGSFGADAGLLPGGLLPALIEAGFGDESDDALDGDGDGDGNGDGDGDENEDEDSGVETV